MSHVSLSPRDPRRGTLSCVDGTTYVFYFPVPSSDRRTREKTPENAAGGPISDTDAASSSFEGKSSTVIDSGVASKGDKVGTESRSTDDYGGGGPIVGAVVEESSMMIVEEEVALEGEGGRSSNESNGVAPNAEKHSTMIIATPIMGSRCNVPPKDSKGPVDDHWRGDTAAAAVGKPKMMGESATVTSEDTGGRGSLVDGVVSFSDGGGNTSYAEGVAGNAQETRDPELDTEKRIILDVVEEIVQNVVLSWNARYEAEDGGKEEEGRGPRCTATTAPMAFDNGPRSIAFISDCKGVSTCEGDVVVEDASAVAALTDASEGRRGLLMNGNIGVCREGESRGRGGAGVGITDDVAPSEDPCSKEVTQADVITGGAIAGAEMLAAGGQGFIVNGEAGEGGERGGIPDEGTPISGVSRQDTDVTEAALGPAGSGVAEMSVADGQRSAVDSDIGACEEDEPCGRGDVAVAAGVSDRAGLVVTEGQDLNGGEMATPGATNQGTEVNGTSVAAAVADVVAPAYGATGSTVAEMKGVGEEDESCGKREGGTGVGMTEEVMPTSNAASHETKVTEAAVASAGVTEMDTSDGQGFVVSGSIGRSEGHKKGTQEAITDCGSPNVSGVDHRGVFAAGVTGAAAAEGLVEGGVGVHGEGKSESCPSHIMNVDMNGNSDMGRGDTTDKLGPRGSESMDVDDDIDVRVKTIPPNDCGDVGGGGSSKRDLGGAAAEGLEEGRPPMDVDVSEGNSEGQGELEGITTSTDVQGGVTSREKASLNSMEVCEGEETVEDMFVAGKQAPSRSDDAEDVGGRSLDEKVSNTADERVGARDGERREGQTFGPPSNSVEVREEGMSEASSSVADNEDGGVREVCSTKEPGSGMRYLDGIRGGDDSIRSINLNSINVNPNAVPRAEFRKIWDPVRQLELFSAADNESGAGSISVPGNVQRNVPETSPAAVALAEGDGEEEMEAGGDGASSSCSGSSYGGSVAVSVVGGLGNGAGSTCSSSSNKPAVKVAAQPGRAVWCQDGETVFLLNHEGEKRGKETPLNPFETIQYLYLI